jgi:hypothetical protein
MRHRIRALQRTLLGGMAREGVECGVEFKRRNEQRSRAFVEQLTHGDIGVGVADQRQVVRSVAACTGKAEALLGLGDHVRQRRRIAPIRIGGEGVQRVLGFDDRPGDRGRVATIDDHWIKAVVAHVFGQPLRTAFLHDLSTLLDAAAIENHHRHGEAAVLRAPPAWCPVRAALFLEGTVAEKGNQRFARQRHVDVLQFGKAEVAAFGHGAGGVGAGMAAQRHSREALRIDGIGIEISAQARQAFLTAVVTAPLRGRDVAGERIDGFDGGDAVALAHDPAARAAGERVGEQVADEGLHHVQRATGVAFWRQLEVLLSQQRAGQVNALRIGHVRDHVHCHATQAVGGSKQGVGRRLIGNAAIGDQTGYQCIYTCDGLLVMDDGAVAGKPALANDGTGGHTIVLLWCR